MALTVDKTNTESGPPHRGPDRNYTMKLTIDFTTAANQIAQTETLGLFKIPKSTLVKEAYFVVRTADANITDVDIGIYSNADVVEDADELCDNLSLAATGLIKDTTGADASWDGATGGSHGYFNTAAAYKKVVLTNNTAATLDEAVVDFFIECTDCS